MNGSVLALAAIVAAAGWWLAPLVDREPSIRLRMGMAAGAAALSTAFSARFEDLGVAIAYGIFSLAVVVLVAIDLRVHRLPREVSYSGFVAMGIALGVVAAIEHDPDQLVGALVGAAIATVVMILIQVLSRGDLGGGDVRMAPLLGLALGWVSPRLVLVGIMVSFAVMALVGLAGMIAGRVKLRSALPFGPCLAAGTVITVLLGQTILDRW